MVQLHVTREVEIRLFLTPLHGIRSWTFPSPGFGAFVDHVHNFSEPHRHSKLLKNHPLFLSTGPVKS